MRYERKYKTENLSLPVVLSLIQSHPAGFKKLFPDRQVNNIYFDTYDLTTYKENVIGIAERKKFRIRWYGDDVTKIQNPIFEIKIKNNLLGDKVSKSFPTFQLQDFEFLNYKKNNLSESIQEFSESYLPLQPVLLNSYHRSYFGTSDGKFRITVDSNMRFFSMLDNFSFVKYILEDEGLVVELKYDETLDDLTDRITQHFPFRMTKSSKYVTGVILVNG